MAVKRLDDKAWESEGRGSNTYDKLSFFRTSKPKYAQRMVDGGIFTMPGAMSDSPEHIAFLNDTVDELSKHYKGDDVMEDGTVGATGVHEPVDRYKTVSGYSMKPMSFTAVDNKAIRTEKGLINSWRRPRDRELFEQLCHLVFKSLKFKNIKANRISTSGFPEFVPDYEKKIGWIDEILRPDSVLKVMRKVREHDLVGLHRDHSLVIAYFVNKRRQEDLASKKRMVIDRDYAITGGLKGRRFEANKEVVLASGRIVPGFSAQRIRPVKGSSIRLTAMLQPFAAGVRAHISTEYAFNWKHTTDEDSSEKLNKYGHLVSTDYTEFDSTYPGFMRESMLKVMEQYFDPAVIELCRLSFAAPYFQPPVFAVPANASKEDIEDLKRRDQGVWVGNPHNPRDFIFNSGIVSGNPFVDLEGKLGGTFDAIVKWDYILGDMDKRMESFLKGQDPLIGNRNQGDDNQALTSDEALQKRFVDITLAKDDAGVYRYSYFAADLEKGHVFTGKITTWYNERGELGKKLRVIPRVGSFLRWFTHERGINAPTRAFWPVGFFERQTLYGGNPAWGDFWRVTNEQWTRHMGSSLEEIAATHWKANEHLMPKIQVRSVADLEVLMDPEKLAYIHADSDQVSPEVRALFEASPDEKQVERYVSTYYRGHIY